ncbi:MAG: DNA replication/repair protein RecF [Actinomycetales bacterium]|nr:DNA replication/repair protein RecF [Actinomycetales bacterium]
MWLAELSLVDVRSYQALNCSFNPGVTVLVGRNGQGKTNIVESIGYLATHTSHRVASDAPMIRLGAHQALITGEVVTKERQVLLELAILQGRANKARVNGVPVPRFREALGYLTSVTFSPEDLGIVKGDPAERRRFLDELIMQHRPRMAAVYSDYEHTLKQRNALLKSGLARPNGGQPSAAAFTSMLAVWDEQLVKLGAQLTVARLAMVEQLAATIVSTYATLAQGAAVLDVALAYRSSALKPDDDSKDNVSLPNDEQSWTALLDEALLKARAQERARGITVVGPHRDDLVLSLGPHPVRGFASQGECWSLALALRLASINVLASQGDSPVVILDDVFAELDSGRRLMLRDFLTGVDQVFITAAVEEDLPSELVADRLDVRDGTVSPRAA